jgi:hypothetical protein
MDAFSQRLLEEHPALRSIRQCEEADALSSQTQSYRLGTEETVQKRSIGSNSKIGKRCDIEQKTANRRLLIEVYNPIV